MTRPARPVHCPAADDTGGPHIHLCRIANVGHPNHVERHPGRHTCRHCDHTWGTLTATEAEDEAAGLQLNRCPVCQHWPAPHRGTCGGTVGRDSTGVDVICGCDGAEYGLAARLHFMESDIAAVVRAGTQAARAGLATTEAMTLLRRASESINARVDGLRDAVAALTDAIADLNGRVNASDARTRELDDSLSIAHTDIDRLWERTGRGDLE